MDLIDSMGKGKKRREVSAELGMKESEEQIWFVYVPRRTSFLEHVSGDHRNRLENIPLCSAVYSSHAPKSTIALTKLFRCLSLPYRVYMQEKSKKTISVPPTCGRVTEASSLCIVSAREQAVVNVK